MSDPTPPHPPEPPRPSRPEPDPEPDPERGAERARASEDQEAEPYDAASETGPVYEAREPGATAGDRNWEVACHLVSLAWLLGMPVVHLLGPLAIWYFVRRDDAGVEHHAKEAFNFQVNMLLWTILGALMIPTCLLTPLGLLLVGGGLVFAAVLPVVAAVKTSEGERYRYPFTFRFLD